MALTSWSRCSLEPRDSSLLGKGPNPDQRFTRRPFAQVYSFPDAKSPAPGGIGFFLLQGGLALLNREYRALNAACPEVPAILSRRGTLGSVVRNSVAYIQAVHRCFYTLRTSLGSLEYGLVVKVTMGRRRSQGT